MKIRINDKIVVEVQVTQTMVCPAGTAYYDINYLIDGMCIHSATTGTIWGQPDVIAMLDRKFTRTSEYHYQDGNNPDPIPTDNADVKLHQGSVNGRLAWWTEEGITHRQAIIEAVSQIVE
jgi:hypothetical protein